MGQVKVYYNSACPVCRAGIASQKQRMQGRADEVAWIDVHADPGVTAEIGANCEFVRERLHVVDESGRLNVGADAFAVLWRRTEGQQRWARFIQAPLARSVAQVAYNLFAALLYRWNRARKRW
jgi:predicted DCC family thiol-disulfide oxidoreductase YuxK